MGEGGRNTALVFGATGYTGNAVVRHWAKVGGVVAHVRPDSPKLADQVANLEGLGARVERVPWEPAAIGELVTRAAPKVVFSLLGTTRARAKVELSTNDNADPYAAIDERLTLMALHAVRDHAPRALFVYLSALGVSGNTQNQYLLARHHVEQHLAVSELRYIVARPAFVTGTDRAEFRLGERVAAVTADGVLAALAFTGVGALRQLRNKFASLTGDELGSALVSLAQSPPKDSEVFPDELRRRASRG